MASIIFVTRATPSDVGPGGKHRAYQIEHDLIEGFGSPSVVTLSLQRWRAQHNPATVQPARRLAGWLARAIGHAVENPLALARRVRYSPRLFAPRQFDADYEALLKQLPQPFVCVIDDARFSGILNMNRRRGIPTAICLHNLEALDMGRIDGGAWRTRSHLFDLSNEIEQLRKCSVRLTNSKVEAGLINGLGLATGFYPYLPVGRIRERMTAIRQQRMRRAQQPGLFLMLGSAMHATTQVAFEHFIRHWRAEGWPAGMRLVVIGANTQLLAGQDLPGIEWRGWVEQSELEQLLAQTQAVLVPQLSGFGAVTRIVELSCAGVPTLMSQHPAYAIDLPPGVHVIGDAWREWRAALEALSDRGHGTPWDYDAWDRAQPRPLRASVAALC